MSDFEQYKEKYGLSNYRFWIVGNNQNSTVLVIEKNAVIIYHNYNELMSLDTILKHKNNTFRLFHSLRDPIMEYFEPDCTDFESLQELQKYMLIMKVAGI